MPKRYILVLLVITAIFFGGIFLLVRLISGVGDDTPKEQTSSQTQTVKKLSTDAQSVTYTVYGKVVAEEDRRAIRITISDSERKLEVLQGYDENVLKSERLSNKHSSFEALLLALETAKFTTRDTSIKTDDRSLCPLGSRFVYETKYDDSNIRSWLTSCTANSASFKGDKSMVDTLFKAQIPKYSEVTNGVVL